MELAAELAVGAELDVDALVEAEIQRLLNRHVLLRRHGCRLLLASSLAPFLDS
jgi:hypothetical protein